MFKLNVPIIKSFQKSNGKFVVEGIASDPTIDRDEERFELDAVKSMAKSVNGGSIPIRVEHEDKVYTDVGKWTEAGMKDNKLYVKGEIDTELSLGKDMSVLLNRGMELALSVGGQVLDAGYEYSKELKKTIKVYKDVVLEEISIIKNPSNYNVSLSMAKSINWEKLEDKVEKNEDKKIEYTTEAKKLTDIYKAMQKVSNEEFTEKHISEDEKKAMDKTKKAKNGKMKDKKGKGYTSKEWAVDVLKTLKPWFKQVEKDCCYEECEEDGYRLTTEDLKMIGQLMNVMANVELPEDMERPKVLEDEDYWMNLVEEQQVVLFNRHMTAPHHNKDLSLNKELVLWHMKRLVDNQMWYTPKDYMVIFSHLYRHLKDLALVKSKKKASKLEKKVSADELKLFKQCHLYLNSHGAVKPTLNDVPLSDEHIEKCALAYKLLTNPETMGTKDKKVTKNAEEEVKETTAAETTEETAEETATEEVAEEKAEETVEEETTEVPAEEEKAEEEEVVEEKEEETTEEAAEEAPEKEEEAAEEVEEEKEEEEAAEEAKEEEEASEETTEKSVKKVDNTFNKKAFAKIEKSVGQLAEIVDGLVEKAKGVNSLEKTVTDLTETVTKQTELLAEMSKRSLGRKSVASAYVALEKNFQEPHKTEDSQEAAEKAMEGGASFIDAYKAKKLAEQGQTA